MTENKIRFPDEYRILDEKKKWQNIISLFMENRIDELIQNHRTGTRGRIFSVLSVEIYDVLGIPYRFEPIFYHIPPKEWYVKFARKHGIKLRTHDFYNPDFFLEDGTWVEFTLSEKAAYQKLFRYGHQADNLVIYWLDEDTGLHKEICENVRFPNAEVRSIEYFYEPLRQSAVGIKTIERLEVLRGLKGVVG